MSRPKDVTVINMVSTDGFRYLEFNPPLFEARLESCPMPETVLIRDEVHTWEPCDFSRRKGLLVCMGFISEAFEGSNYTFEQYAETVAEHIGNAVVAG